METSRAPQMSFDVDGRPHTETTNGRSVRPVHAAVDQLKVTADGRGFGLRGQFEPLDDGQSLRVTRRLYATTSATADQRAKHVSSNVGDPRLEHIRNATRSSRAGTPIRRTTAVVPNSAVLTARWTARSTTGRGVKAIGSRRRCAMRRAPNGTTRSSRDFRRRASRSGGRTSVAMDSIASVCVTAVPATSTGSSPLSTDRMGRDRLQRRSGHEPESAARPGDSARRNWRGVGAVIGAIAGDGEGAAIGRHPQRQQRHGYGLHRSEPVETCHVARSSPYGHGYGASIKVKVRSNRRKRSRGGRPSDLRPSDLTPPPPSPPPGARYDSQSLSHDLLALHFEHGDPSVDRRRR